MSTNDVPGHNPVNRDVLAMGAWAEHDDGSLIFVKGVEMGKVVYEIYDTAVIPPVYYPAAMIEDEFKNYFSWQSGDGKKKERWLWHDKTLFPWDRVMSSFNRPVPQPADVEETLSAAARVAESLKLRAQKVKKEDLMHQTDRVVEKGKSILERIGRAIDAFNE